MDAQQRLLAYVLIGVGALFLFATVFSFTIWVALPFFAVGGIFLYLATKTCHWLAVPGMLITGTGIINLTLAVLNHWQGWAYAWTLYGVFLGIAFVFVSEAGEKDMAPIGRMFIQVGLIAFGLMALFFELFIFNTFGFLGNLLIAAAFIAAGYVLLNGELSFGVVKAKRKIKNEERDLKEIGIF